jgi:hypothetical protein
MFTQHTRQVTDTALDERVVSLLTAAAAPSEPGPLPGEAKALAAFRASRNATRRPSMLMSLMTVKTAAAAALSAGVLLTGSVGAAAAGALPAAAQDSASELLAKVGVSVPTAAEAAGERADGREAPGGRGGEHTKSDNTANDHGEQVSETARREYPSGRDRGAAVSDKASDGRSRAGEHGGDEPADHGSAVGHRSSKPLQGDRADEPKADVTGDQADGAKADGSAMAEDAEEKAESTSPDGAPKAGGEDHSTEGSAHRP